MPDDRLTARLPRRFHALTGYVAEVRGERMDIDPDRIDVIPRGRDAAPSGSVTPLRRAATRRTLDVLVRVAGSGRARLVPSHDPTSLGEAVVATSGQTADERRSRAEVAQARFAATFALLRRCVDQGRGSAIMISGPARPTSS
jgi:hypothetical protein